MDIGTIITMGSLAVGSAVAEKVLIYFGKTDAAQFCNISTMCGLGGTAISGVVTLFSKLRGM